MVSKIIQKFHSHLANLNLSYCTEAKCPQTMTTVLQHYASQFYDSPIKMKIFKYLTCFQSDVILLLWFVPINKE